ncbi:hypothetical protein LEP1GSC013_2655 [Leptospira interrogans serovar Valbuzzi str. Duyster]|nr:hypothetical protein LEP1GSC013_2655 [Leptospira interrogans serovar Valbuzzi str. Duyster]ENO73277.1 hypothetical protein LEP1GSC012_2961 [Leptospira interrogans serovar Valbuzzi str. Valbuzzi]
MQIRFLLRRAHQPIRRFNCFQFRFDFIFVFCKFRIQTDSLSKRRNRIYPNLINIHVRGKISVIIGINAGINGRRLNLFK